MNAFMNFLHMGGYALYVWPAYGSVLFLLFLQWLRPWRAFKRSLHE